MDAETASVLGSLAGVVGGLLGVASFVLTVRDRRARARTEALTRGSMARAHDLPVELRPILVDLLWAVEQIEREERDGEWVTEHLEPVAHRLEASTSTVRSRGAGDLDPARSLTASSVSLLQASLQGIRVSVLRPRERRPSTWGLDQRRLASTARKQIVELLDVMSAAGK